ncbi:MAG TPA: hypothetical protein VHX62_10980 [Solirubrobacteraceae bacterium]|jgi:hypothetical protein|nr:hypothetical protein [Solirubrobacteraceae bacterium]
MSDHLEALIESLLWEGYALYPYTPGAAKNATPTPFGIVYPPVYAATLSSTFDHLTLGCVLEAAPDAILRAEVRFLTPAGERHQARAHRIELPGTMAGGLGDEPAAKRVTLDAGGPEAPPLSIAIALSARPLPGTAREYAVDLRVENRTLVSSGLDRAGALRRSLISTHPILRVTGGRFISALDRPCGSVNTFPVLAAADDDAMVGAAIVLPDHPQIAPESRGGLFDSTEIEEALLLHVQALSDGERAEIERQDPAVREMIARAAAATPQDIIALHGRVTLRDPVTTEPPAEPPGLVDPRVGESSVDVDGRTFRRGGKVVIRPGPDADIQARMLEGRTATIERIFTDYDGRMHLGLTIDGDPGQDLMRDTGRYLFFFAPEVEVLEP